MGSRRHINLPGVKVNLPPLTEKDLADVAVGAEMQVDFVALSFCREPSDVEELRRVLREHGSTARIVAKIEDQLAVKNIDEIIQTTDVIMVARGDLGIECPMEELPIIQRRIVKRCLQQGVPVIVATHMLESMIANPVPTRAEITDVANAVFEQADAIMLSGETTVGKYPVKCVEVMDKVAERIERSGGAGFAEEALLEDDRQKTVHSAVSLANSLPDAKIVVFTRRGTMADYVSNLRPNAPIYAFAPDLRSLPQARVNWGTYPHQLAFDPNPNRTIGAAINYLVEQKLAEIRRPPRHRQRHARRRGALRHHPAPRRAVTAALKHERHAELFELRLLLGEPLVAEAIEAALGAEVREEGVHLRAQIVAALAQADRPRLLLKGREDGARRFGIFAPVFERGHLVDEEGVALPLRDFEDARRGLVEDQHARGLELLRGENVSRWCPSPRRSRGRRGRASAMDGMSLAGGDEQAEAGPEIRLGEVDRLRALRRGGHRGNDEVDLAGLERGDEAGEGQVLNLDGLPEMRAERTGEIDAHAGGLRPLHRASRRADRRAPCRRRACDPAARPLAQKQARRRAKRRRVIAAV